MNCQIDCVATHNDYVALHKTYRAVHKICHPYYTYTKKVFLFITCYATKLLITLNSAIRFDILLLSVLLLKGGSNATENEALRVGIRDA